MKSCKLVNSTIMGNKAKALNLHFSLFGGWADADSFMYVENGKVGSGNSRSEYLQLDFTEITQKDFLALPEPFKVGDWVKVQEDSFTLIGRVDSITETYIQVITGMHSATSTYRSKCTKLTQEQINILELETI